MERRNIKKILRPSIVSSAMLAACAVILPAGNIARADDDLAKGKAIYDGAGACFSCHGPLGAGDGIAAASLNPKPRSFVDGKFNFDTDGDGKTGTEADLFNIVTNGAQKYGGSLLMVARPDIAEADRKAVIKYVLSLKKP